MPERKSSREIELVGEGWTKQFCATGSRIQEATELYESMGFEVLLEPVRVEDLGCSECLEGPAAPLSDCSVIYTRPKKDGESKKSAGARKRDDELW